MSVSLITFILFASLGALLVTGLPLAFVMGGLATLFTYILLGTDFFTLITSNVYGTMSDFLLMAIPLFVFMGVILHQSGIAEEAYNMMYKWIGGIKGGLAMGTVLICTIFAALTGVSAASTVTMGVIALPSMIQKGYDKDIAIGCICAGGTLGVLIPPSVLMIVYGVFASESIGKLFAGGVLPGVMISSLFIAYIAIRSYLQPQLCPSIPPEERVSWKERFISLKAVIFPVLLIFAVLGSIFFGIATATEAAAFGSLGALLCAFFKRKLTLETIKESCFQTLRLSGMVLWIILGSKCFTSIYAAVGAIEYIRSVVSVMPLSPSFIIVGIMIVLFILGMFIDPGAIIMLTTPIFIPVIKMLGFNPVWFGVMFIINMQIGYLTPPFGFNLFYMKQIVPKDIAKEEDIFFAIIPFVLLMGVSILICVIFPEVILWLPNLLFD